MLGEPITHEKITTKQFIEIKNTQGSFAGMDLSGVDFNEVKNSQESSFRDGRIELAGFNLSNTIFGNGQDLIFIDFARANLSGADLSGANLGMADFTGANLSGADLSGTNLEGASLTDANLTRANLTGANLTGAILSGVILEEAILDRSVFEMMISNNKYGLKKVNLSGKDLSEIYLTHVNLEEADLSGTKLSKVKFISANLKKANLCGSDLSGANLSAAKLCEADLTEANLTYANLTEANLEGADLTEANLEGADLSTEIYWMGIDFGGADFTRANLRKVNLSNANLAGANFTDVDFAQANLKGVFQATFSSAIIIYDFEDPFYDCYEKLIDKKIPQVILYLSEGERLTEEQKKDLFKIDNPSKILEYLEYNEKRCFVYDQTAQDINKIINFIEKYNEKELPSRSISSEGITARIMPSVPELGKRKGERGE